MKLKPIILAILFIISGILYYQISDDNSNDFQESTNIIHAKVIRIIDGDTIELNTSQTLRLSGINTPEKSMDQFIEASNLVSNLTLNKTIKIQISGTDKYNRILGVAFYDNQNINQILLENGLATLYYYEKDEFYDSFKNSEQKARDSELGIWEISPNQDCIEILKFEIEEPESLILKNNCDIELDLTIKDDATHIYKETISKQATLNKTFSHVFNNAGDTLYIWDTNGLLIFNRY